MVNGLDEGPFAFRQALAVRNDVGRDEDDEFGLDLDRFAPAKQTAENRNVAHQGDLVLVGHRPPPPQAPDDNCLTVPDHHDVRCLSRLDDGNVAD